MLLLLQGRSFLPLTSPHLLCPAPPASWRLAEMPGREWGELSRQDISYSAIWLYVLWTQQVVREDGFEWVWQMIKVYFFYSGAFSWRLEFSCWNPGFSSVLSQEVASPLWVVMWAGFLAPGPGSTSSFFLLSCVCLGLFVLGLPMHAHVSVGGALGVQADHNTAAPVLFMQADHHSWVRVSGKGGQTWPSPSWAPQVGTYLLCL